MANQILLELGTQIRFVGAGFSPADSGTNWTRGTPTDVALTVSAVASAAARQSAKFDFGENWAEGFSVKAAVDYTGETPSATGRTSFYIAPSSSSTAGDGNVAGNSGGDAACPDGALGSITLVEFLLMCDFVGDLMTHDGAVVQNGLVNKHFRPTDRYAQLIQVNNGGDAYEADGVEAHVVFDPVPAEIQ